MILATAERRQAKRAYSLKDIHEETDLSLPYLRQLVSKDELKVVRFGRAIRVLSEDYENFLRCGVNTVNEAE